MDRLVKKPLICWIPNCSCLATGETVIVCPQDGKRATVQACDEHKGKTISASFTERPSKSPWKGAHAPLPRSH